MTQKDNLYNQSVNAIEPFTFNAQVAAVFDDMIARSVPGYHDVHALICDVLLELPFPVGGCFYDLGASTGTLTAMAAQRLQSRCARFVGVDVSAAMLTQARAKWSVHEHPRLDFVEADVRLVPLDQAAVVVLNYTLQFIAPAERDALLMRIYQSLPPGGVCVVTEKICATDPVLNLSLIKRHERFKLDHGYSQLEIAQKRKALENVLIPDTLPILTQRLERAGFAVVQPFWQWLNFVAVMAVKGGV